MKIRDIAIYDNDKLIAIVKKAKSYKDASNRFREAYPDHPIVTSQYGYDLRNADGIMPENNVLFYLIN